jgi:hypothetical protein
LQIIHFPIDKFEIKEVNFQKYKWDDGNLFPLSPQVSQPLIRNLNQDRMRIVTIGKFYIHLSKELIDEATGNHLRSTTPFFLCVASHQMGCGG